MLEVLADADDNLFFPEKMAMFTWAYNYVLI